MNVTRRVIAKRCSGARRVDGIATAPHLTRRLRRHPPDRERVAGLQRPLFAIHQQTDRPFADGELLFKILVQVFRRTDRVGRTLCLSCHLEFGGHGELNAALRSLLVGADDCGVEFHAGEQILQILQILHRDHAMRPFRVHGEFLFERNVSQVLLQDERERLQGAARVRAHDLPVTPRDLDGDGAAFVDAFELFVIVSEHGTGEEGKLLRLRLLQNEVFEPPPFALQIGAVEFGNLRRAVGGVERVTVRAA